MKILSVIPAYGREYTEESQIQRDWDNSLDFRICDTSDPYYGKYINLEDARNAGLTNILVLYKNRSARYNIRVSE